MYTCGEIEKLLNTYTDGELDEPDRLRVMAHLQECALCSQLARREEDEARLIHSGILTPTLSADFTGRVMSNLSRSKYPARGEGFFPLRKLLTRPWLAPALVGLLLLAAVSWAASSRLLPPGHGRVALQTPASSADNSPALTLPMTGVSEPAKLPGKKASASGEEARPWSSRTIGFSPSKNPNTVNEAVYKTVETQTANPALPQATSNRELERQGYTVFEPGYLPAGYSLASCYLLPPGSMGGTGSQAPSGGGTAPLPGWSSLLSTYRNTQTGGWLVLQIRPVNSSAPAPDSALSGENQAGTASPPGARPETSTKETTKEAASSSVQPPPAVPEASPSANTTTGASTSAITTGNQPPEADRITWQAQKHGSGFLLTVSGSLSGEELQKVAASLQ